MQYAMTLNEYNYDNPFDRIFTYMRFASEKLMENLSLSIYFNN